MTDQTDQTEVDTGPAHGDVANATRFLADHGDRFRYHAAARRWLTYLDGVWRDDPDRIGAREAAETVMRDLLREAADEPDAERAKALVAEARRGMSAARLRAMLEVSEPHIAVATDELDADPWLLNTTSGVVDLRTGRVHPHDPKMLLTRQTAAAFRSYATAPTWETFLTEILPDADVRAFFARLVGSTLVGAQRDHVLPIMHGTGANGKSTAIAAVEAALGDYAGKIATDVLIGKAERSGATPELVRLRGQRLVVADEPEAGGRLRESHVKALTGGDTIIARGLYSDPIEFTPTHTLALVTNHRPEVQGSDEGIWRRLLMVPFAVTIPPHRQDPDLPAKLAAEIDGVLAWAVDGCLDYQQRGLDPPKSVQDATAAYRAEQDHIAAFIEDCCLTSTTVRAPAGQLLEAYEQWCHANGITPKTATAFGTTLTDHGHPVKRGSGGRRYREGIALRADEPHT